MAGLKIKSSGPIALVDRAGGPQLSGNDIAPSLGHTNLASGEVRLSHFFAGYGNLGLGTTGFGDGYKLWQNAAPETETVPNLAANAPAEIEADGDDVPEIKFSDFYDVRQQDLAISVVEARFNATSHTNVSLYGFAQQSIFAQSTGNDSFGQGVQPSYNFNYRESMCSINGATTAGWRITGMYAQKTSGNVNRQFLHMQWDAGSGTVPTRANSGWSSMDAGRWDGTSRLSPSGLPNLTETAQMQRIACLFVANQGTGKSYWQQTYDQSPNSTVTIHRHASTYGTTNWYMILLDEYNED